MYAYNLEITPKKDDVFAQLLLTLFDDLEETRAELACKQVDTTGTAPLSSKVCSALATQWSNVKNSLDRCYSASVQPKSSASKERCNTFLVKLRAYGTVPERREHFGSRSRKSPGRIEGSRERAVPRL